MSGLIQHPKWPLGCRFIDHTGRKFTVRHIKFGDAINELCNIVNTDDGIIYSQKGGYPQSEVGFIQDGADKLIIQSLEVMEELYRTSQIKYLAYGS